MKSFSKFRIDQISTSCLSQFTYFIKSGKYAAIVDPLRDINAYVDLLKQTNSTLKYIFLTHIHADFVSGHIPLAKLTNADIVLGPEAESKIKYRAKVCEDNQTLSLGDSEIKIMHTPGHTNESSCFLVRENNKNEIILTGDTLFLGEVGRPDLGVIGNIPPETLARRMFQSLKKIKTLDDDVIVYPGHGAGSLCGKNIMKGSYCTIGNQKKRNKFLKIENEEEFVKEMTSSFPALPKYFLRDVKLNLQSELSSADDIYENKCKSLSPSQFAELKKNPDVLIIDTRNTEDFKQEFILGSVNIPLNSSLAVHAGCLFNDEQIVVIADHGMEKESVIRLARVGIDSIVGFLKGGIEEYNEKVDALKAIDPEDLETLISKNKLNVLDVREKSEYLASHLECTKNIPLSQLVSLKSSLDKSLTYYIHCASGVRSTIACSYLIRDGFKVVNINKGFRGLCYTKLKQVSDN